MSDVTVSGGLPDIKPRKSATLSLPIFVGRSDKPAEIGKLMQTAARKVADKVTTLCAETPGNYNIDIIVTIEETDPE